MKLGKSVLLEIVAIVQDSLLAQEDASARLREIDVVVDGSDGSGDFVGEVVLSPEYLKEHGRA